MNRFKLFNRTQKIMLALCSVFLIGGIFCTAVSREEVAPMTNLEFFESLDYEDSLSVVTQTFDRFSLQYGTTLGLDGNPQIRPIEFKFEQDGVLYFDTVEFYSSYAELKAHPLYSALRLRSGNHDLCAAGRKSQFHERPRHCKPLL